MIPYMVPRLTFFQRAILRTRFIDLTFIFVYFGTASIIIKESKLEIVLSRIAILTIFFACILAVPAVGADLSKEEFLKRSASLAKQFDNDGWVDRFVERSQSAAEKALNDAYCQVFGMEHQAQWLLHYNNGLESAHKQQWKEAEEDLALASIPELDYNSGHRGGLGLYTPNQYADIYFVRALVKQVMGQFQDSLSDLKLLYEFRKNNPNSWNTGSAIFKQQKKREVGGPPTSQVNSDN